MSIYEEAVEIEVPASTAYNQWTQFQEFPQFMEGVESVTQMDDQTLKWVAEIGGQRREWIADITEQKPDERIAWVARDGVKNAGVVTFHKLTEDKSRVSLQMEFEPEGLMENAANLLGLVKMRVKGDLKRFKEFIESRTVETGAWRGEIPNDN